jgi:hypothetical protein
MMNRWDSLQIMLALTCLASAWPTLTNLSWYTLMQIEAAL